MGGTAKTGRPTLYSEELVETICARMADGESLRAICFDEDMPARETVSRWLRDDSEKFDSFRHNYALAQTLRHELLFDEVIDIADGTHEAADALAEDAATNAPENRAADAYRRTYNEEVNARRLRLDARKWALGRMNRSKYGDSSNLRVGGDPDSPPVGSVQTTVALDPSALTTEQRDQALELAHAAMQRGAVKS